MNGTKTYTIVTDGGRETDGKMIQLRTARKRFAKGHFIVRQKGHVFAMINGVVLDTGFNSEFVRVQQVWKVTNI